VSTFLRKLIFVLIGLLAGLAAWPVTEIILYFQTLFSSYLIFSVIQGVCVGGVMGGFFGSIESITLSKRGSIIPSVFMGAVIGIFGGLIGFLLGQGVLTLVMEYSLSNQIFINYGIPISRITGWTCLGLFIGSVEGIRSMSWIKIKVGITGGLIGGLLGGLSLEFLRLLIPEIMYARLVGLLIMGSLIGLFYSLIEHRYSIGVLKLLNGKLKNKEFLIVNKLIKIGSSDHSDIQLKDYTGIADFHAEIHIRENKILIANSDSKNPVIVNEYRIKEHLLKYEDIVHIGTAKLLFLYK
jgi:hypothetical protein